MDKTERAEIADITVLYHANCVNGFGAMCAARMALGTEGVEYQACVYGAELMGFNEGDHIYMLDFSFPADAVKQWLSQGCRVTILDHHKTAEVELGHLLAAGALEGVIDQERSGATLAWAYFHGEENGQPWLLRRIEDRDLWRFRYDDTRAVHAALMAFPREYKRWEGLMGVEGSKHMTWVLKIERLVADGKAILRYMDKLVADLVKNAYRSTWGEHKVPVANVPPQLASDVGAVLAKGEPFAMTYNNSLEGRVYQLRSDEDGLDVSEIAQREGGGGHKHAAGFVVPWGRSLRGHGSPLVNAPEETDD